MRLQWFSLLWLRINMGVSANTRTLHCVQEDPIMQVSVMARVDKCTRLRNRSLMRFGTRIAFLKPQL